MAEGHLIRMGIGIDTLSLDHGPSKDFPTLSFFQEDCAAFHCTRCHLGLRALH